MIDHLIPFINSANEVLSMYSLRQKVAEKKLTITQWQKLNGAAINFIAFQALLPTQDTRKRQRQ